MLKHLDTNTADFHDALRALLSATAEPDQAVIDTVSAIIGDVRRRGAPALLEYTNRFDRRRATLDQLEIGQRELAAALDKIPAELRRGLEHAAERIRAFHERQTQASWTFEDAEGNLLGQKVTPLDRVGVYVPGGKAAYPSSVLMNVIPARVAGVREIIMAVPTPDEGRNEAVLAAAAIAGADRVFTVGGAQAIAALAYGAGRIPRVDKITGPGNIYVATAKRQVFGQVGIDMIAGPSEVVIVSDGSGDPEWAVIDLFAQAEHDEMASAILICTEADFIRRAQACIEKRLPEMERAGIIRASLNNNGALIKVNDLAQAIELVNIIAPEHLELAVSDPDALLNDIRHAGAIFMGRHSAEALGDYCAGPNHVLPTGRCARFSSPLGVYDFQKQSSIIKCRSRAVTGIAKTAATLARAEGLTAHARSAELRLKP